MKNQLIKFLLLSTILVLNSIPSIGQQIGHTRIQIQEHFKKGGISCRNESLFSNKNIDNNLLITTNDFGSIEFVFTNEICSTIMYVPKDFNKAQWFIKKLNERFLSNDNKKWKGVENDKLVETKIYYTNSNTVIFVKKSLQ
ncbi:hypothetical protein [Hymenobacter sp. UYP22]|uniref:hypothetical protein n=1 Tax=Hymenobacter sp. UYP22 TaxID=3156348 RepID=UPI0033925681